MQHPNPPQVNEEYVLPGADLPIPMNLPTHLVPYWSQALAHLPKARQAEPGIDRAMRAYCHAAHMLETSSGEIERLSAARVLGYWAHVLGG